MTARRVKRAPRVEGDPPGGRSGKLLIRLPKSLHASLAREAEAEGVSMNQLMVAKLSVSLGRLVARAEPDSC